MTRERARIGFDPASEDVAPTDALEGFDPTEWTPSARRIRPVKEDTRKAADATGFRSREPETAGQPAVRSAMSAGTEREGGPGLVRRRRTGRNAQFNLKARPETIERFCAVADAQGWGLGETLEKAVELLERGVVTSKSP